jgi:hypothetical protein
VKAGKTNGVKRPRGRGIATARVGVGLVSDKYGEKTPTPTPSAENGVGRRRRHEGREKKQDGERGSDN